MNLLFSSPLERLPSWKALAAVHTPTVFDYSRNLSFADFIFLRVFGPDAWIIDQHSRVTPPPSPLLFQINMEAVTSTDYDSSNLSRNFNQVGFNTYNYSQFEEKYKPRQVFKYGDEYLEYGRNSVRLGPNERFTRLSSRHQDVVGKSDQRYTRSHSQPERQQHPCQEIRSKSQDSRELTFYQIDPPVKVENVQHHPKPHRSAIEKNQSKKELTFYEIDGPGSQEKSKDVKLEGGKEREEKRDKCHGGQEKANATTKHGKQSHQEQKANPPPHYHQLNRSQSDLTECQLPNYYRHQNNPYIDPPKYRQFDKPPKYQETPPKSEPPPKYSEVARRQDDYKRVQVRKLAFAIDESFDDTNYPDPFPFHLRIVSVLPVPVDHLESRGSSTNLAD